MAKNVITKKTNFSFNHSDQVEDYGKVAADFTVVQTNFDSRASETLTALNTFIDILQAAATGSYSIGHDSLSIAADNVGDALEENRLLINDKAESDDVYTKTELNSGQLDNRYYTEAEVDTKDGALQQQIDLLATQGPNAKVGIFTIEDATNTNDYVGNITGLTLFDDLRLDLEVTNPNTGSATLDIGDGGGAKSIKFINSQVNKVDLPSGELFGVNKLKYDGVDWVLLQKDLKNIVNIKSFGAKGDGVTDDTQALQDALDSLGTKASIYFPAGTYLIGELTISTYKEVSLIGENMYRSIIKYTGSTLMLDFNSAGRLFTENIMFESDTVAGYLNGKTAISVGTGGVMRMENTYIKGFETTILWNGGFYHKFIGCRFTDTDIVLKDFSANNLTLINCRFNDANRVLSTLGGYGPISVLGCSFENYNGVVFNLSVDVSLNVKGCYFEDDVDTVDTFIFYNAKALTIEDCTFQLPRTKRVVYSDGNLKSLKTNNNNFIFESTNSNLEFVFRVTSDIESIDLNDVYTSESYGAIGSFTTQYCNLANIPNLTFNSNNNFLGGPRISSYKEPTLLNGWVQSVGSAANIVKYEIQDGYILLSGDLDGGLATSDTPFAIPEIVDNFQGYQRQLVVDTAGNTYIFRVFAGGSVSIDGGSTNNNISLNGVRIEL